MCSLSNKLASIHMQLKTDMSGKEKINKQTPHFICIHLCSVIKFLSGWDNRFFHPFKKCDQLSFFLGDSFTSCNFTIPSQMGNEPSPGNTKCKIHQKVALTVWCVQSREGNRQHFIALDCFVFYVFSFSALLGVDKCGGNTLLKACSTTSSIASPCWKGIIWKLNAVYFSDAGRWKQSAHSQTLKNMSFVFHLEPTRCNLTAPPKYKATKTLEEA